MRAFLRDLNVLERIREFRSRSPKTFDLACAVAVGFVLAWLWAR